MPGASSQTSGKGFVLVPIHDVVVKHLTYDSGAVHRLIIRAEDSADNPFPENPKPVHRNFTAYEKNILVL